MSRTDQGQAGGAAASELWTVEDVAGYFRVSIWTIRDWRRVDATFPAPLDLPGRSLRWHRDDVIEWASSLRGQLA